MLLDYRQLAYGMRVNSVGTPLTVFCNGPLWLHSNDIPLLKIQSALSTQHPAHFNLLKPSGNFTYHHASHSKILHGAYIAFMCFVRISEQTATFAL
jgi:hypothetical protein